LNIDWAVNYWLNNGLPKEKLILGLATYGRVFKLADPSQNTPGSLNNGTGSVGKFTREAGFLSYYEICDKLTNSGWTRVWSDEQSVPYAHGQNEWVGYDDVESLKIKVIFRKQFVYVIRRQKREGQITSQSDNLPKLSMIF
jgi:chitinase